jgi:transcriptional regulator with XRE-family HTH domain
MHRQARRDEASNHRLQAASTAQSADSLPFGALVRALRQARGLSLRALAQGIGRDASYLSRIETGQKPPPAAETIEQLAAVLGVPPALLLARTGKMPRRVTTMLGTSPAALAFVQHAHTLGVTETEWLALARYLRHLRRR